VSSSPAGSGELPAAAEGTGRPALSKAQVHRRDRLLDFLEAGEAKVCSDILRNRTVQELTSSGPIDQRHVSVMVLATYLERRSPLNYGAMPALAAAGRAAVPTILKVLEEARSQAEEAGCVWLLAALGRMGPEAKEAIPGLRQLLDRKGLSAAMRASARVALANAGWDSKENRDQLLTDLRAKSEASEATLRAMAWGGLGTWAGEDVAAELGKLLGRTGGDWDYAAIALGTMGERGRAAVPALTAALEDKAGASSPIILRAALARIHPPGEKRVEATRMLLKAIGSFQREKVRALMQVSALQGDAQLRADIVKLLADADADVAVAGGAVSYLLIDARETPEARAPLGRLVQGPGDAAQRAIAARALGLIGTPGEVDAIEKLLTAEKDAAVRAALEKSLALLKTDWLDEDWARRVREANSPEKITQEAEKDIRRLRDELRRAWDVLHPPGEL
jgi:HEAT repeat protein